MSIDETHKKVEQLLCLIQSINLGAKFDVGGLIIEQLSSSGHKVAFIR